MSLLLTLILPTLVSQSIIYDDLHVHLIVGASLSSFMLLFFHPSLFNDSSPSPLVHLLVWYVGGSVAWFVLFLLFHAPLTLNSLLFAVQTSNHVGLALPVLEPKVVWSTIEAIVRKTRLQGIPNDFQLRAFIVSTSIGIWLGAFPAPLDWDVPWQVWPVPSYVLSLVGGLIGLCIPQTCRASCTHRVERLMGRGNISSSQ